MESIPISMSEEQLKRIEIAASTIGVPSATFIRMCALKEARQSLIDEDMVPEIYSFMDKEVM